MVTQRHLELALKRLERSDEEEAYRVYELAAKNGHHFPIYPWRMEGSFEGSIDDCPNTRSLFFDI